jgi:hypothetical protein
MVGHNIDRLTISPELGPCTSPSASQQRERFAAINVRLINCGPCNMPSHDPMATRRIDRQDIENEPKPGTPEADRFNLLAWIIEDYERKRWPIEPPDRIDVIRYRIGNGRLYPSRSWPPARLAPARI